MFARVRKQSPYKPNSPISMDYRILKLEETIEIVQVPDYEMASFLV
jgi:hypothetical protein